jgi:hypothetical protein
MLAELIPEAVGVLVALAAGGVGAAKLRALRAARKAKREALKEARGG